MKPKYHDKPELSLNKVMSVAEDLFASHPEIFNIAKLPRGTTGEFYHKSWDIKVSFSHEIIPTLIHEIIHLMFPKWSETKVLWHERHLMKQMTDKKAKKLLKQFAEIL